MTQTYCSETIAHQRAGQQIPFAELLARALVARLTGRKATLQQIASLLPAAANAEAARQEMRRFLDQPALAPRRWARVLARLLPTGSPWVLALDRTQCKVGAKPVNVLVLALVCAGCAVPLLWTPSEKPGASDI